MRAVRGAMVRSPREVRAVVGARGTRRRRGERGVDGRCAAGGEGGERRAREMKAPSELHGFELVREDYIAEYDAKAFLFRHLGTGAEVMSLSNEGENKAFGVAFDASDKFHGHSTHFGTLGAVRIAKVSDQRTVRGVDQGVAQHVSQRDDVAGQDGVPGGVVQLARFPQLDRRLLGCGVPPAMHHEREDVRARGLALRA